MIGMFTRSATDAALAAVLTAGWVCRRAHHFDCRCR
jgi:hypothetical protein